MLKMRGKDHARLLTLARNVRSGDPENCEGTAANYYWGNLFDETLQFRRGREGEPPNNLLNYGYAILRAMVARCLVGSGLLPTLGIHHRNKYNAYCLADDVMEPYRPYVDQVVCNIVESGLDYNELTTDIKKELIGIASTDVMLDGESSPMFVGMQRTTASLAHCFDGTSRKICYPEM